MFSMDFEQNQDIADHTASIVIHKTMHRIRQRKKFGYKLHNYEMPSEYTYYSKISYRVYIVFKVAVQIDQLITSGAINLQYHAAHLHQNILELALDLVYQQDPSTDDV